MRKENWKRRETMANQHKYWRGRISEVMAEFNTWIGGAGANVTIISHTIATIGPTAVVLSVVYSPV